VAWGILLAVHYFVYKARTVDERWVAERADDLRSKSYDASHIDSIAERHGMDAPRPPDKPDSG
jgi:hypothetical protein